MSVMVLLSAHLNQAVVPCSLFGTSVFLFTRVSLQVLSWIASVAEFLQVHDFQKFHSIWLRPFKSLQVPRNCYCYKETWEVVKRILKLRQKLERGPTSKLLRFTIGKHRQKRERDPSSKLLRLTIFFCLTKIIVRFSRAESSSHETNHRCDLNSFWTRLFSIKRVCQLITECNGFYR